MFDPAPETKIDLEKEVEALRAEVKALTEALKPMIEREAARHAAAEAARQEESYQRALEYEYRARFGQPPDPDCSMSRSSALTDRSHTQRVTRSWNIFRR